MSRTPVDRVFIKEQFSTILDWSIKCILDLSPLQLKKHSTGDSKKCMSSKLRLEKLDSFLYSLNKYTTSNLTLEVLISGFSLMRV